SVYRFFFQAEDGIRDKLVTGVQTCAFRSVLQWSRPADGLIFGVRPKSPNHTTSVSSKSPRAFKSSRSALSPRSSRGSSRSLRLRSEERRVGKECRDRWWEVDLEKKSRRAR